MPHRAMNIVFALAGAIALIAMILVGMDIFTSARKGGKWKRRILTAGLLLLGLTGISCAKKTEWQQITSTYTEAEEIADGKRGDYPFNKNGKKSILADLQKANENCDALVNKGTITKSEAELLKMDIAELVSGVHAKLPMEYMTMTCYEYTQMIFNGVASTKDLTARMELLEKLAGQEKLNKKVVEKILINIKEDLATLNDPEEIKRIPKSEQKQNAEQAREQAEKLIEKIMSKMETPASQPATNPVAD